jgi:hypothetical protein
MTERTLLVTGTHRSGTTLLEKLLSGQRHISILSQPFPLLFVEAKRAFLQTLGLEDERYPLGHLFLESRYQAAQLSSFLARWRTSSPELEALFSRMTAYSGQYTKFAPEHLRDALSTITAADDFAAVVSKLDRHLALSSGAEWFGSKETICEEFLPYLLDRGFRCAIILRDPRDVMASLNHGEGEAFGGSIRPTWFNVRSWRKSVALALSLEEHPRFQWCRYEELVHEPAATLTRLADGLAIGPIDEDGFTGELRDKSGAVWRGNSSHREHVGVTAASVGAFRGLLPASVSEAVEAACLPELQLLGYETAMTQSEAVRCIAGFAEPYAVRRDGGMERDFATEENSALEIERLERVMRPVGDESVRWFLSKRAHARMGAAFRG